MAAGENSELSGIFRFSRGPERKMLGITMYFLLGFCISVTLLVSLFSVLGVSCFNEPRKC